MLKTLQKEPQRLKVYFIIAAERDGKIPKRKTVGAQPSDKKVEEISKRPDTAHANQRLQVAGGKIANFLEWCEEPVKMRANELKLNFS